MLKNLIAFAFLLLACVIKGQDTKHIINQVDSIKNFYYSETYKEYDYLNGKEYKPYYNPSTSSPLLESSMGEGTIYNKGVTYKDLTLLYDRNLDELIAMPKKYLAENIYVCINKAWVDSFTISFDKTQYHFIHHKKEGSLAKGYYEIPYKGKYNLFVNYITNNLYHNGILTYYPKTERFLQKDNQFFPIKRKKDVLNLFPEKKKELRKKFRSFHKPYKQLTNYQLSQVIQLAE